MASPKSSVFSNTFKVRFNIKQVGQRSGFINILIIKVSGWVWFPDNSLVKTYFYFNRIVKFAKLLIFYSNPYHTFKSSILNGLNHESFEALAVRVCIPKNHERYDRVLRFAT